MRQFVWRLPLSLHPGMQNFLRRGRNGRFTVPLCELYYSNRDQRLLSTYPGTSELSEPLTIALDKLSQLCKNTTSLNELSKLRQLVLLLLKRPQARTEVWRAGGIPVIIKLSQCGKDSVEQQARMALSLMGHPPPYPGRGLRILAIDGGGSRGIIPLIILRRLEALTGMKTHQMFDYVCGTSTGAIVTCLLFVQRASIEEAEQMYRQFSVQVFKMNNLLGIGQLFLNHAFYDSKQLERVIRSHPIVEKCLYETAMDRHTIPFSVVSTVVSQPVMQPFLFANYCHRPSQRDHTHYQSDCGFRLWEAIMASTAAPGFFEEVRLGPHVLQDGALLTNNPTAVALHEARLLWGTKAPIQTVVSLGTGLYSAPPTNTNTTINSNYDVMKGGFPPTSFPRSTSLKEKLTKIVLSATDTEAVHTIMKDLLPTETYFRLNPTLSEDIVMDESKPEKLDILVREAENYVAANEWKLQLAAASLVQGKRPEQRVWELVERGLNSMRKRTKSHIT